MNATRLTLTASILLAAAAPAFGDFISGADFSDVAYFQSQGVSYLDGGVPQAEPLTVLKNHGLTCVRLRLWTSSAAQALSDPYDYINNMTYTVPLAVRVKNAGLQFMLDFHYSDTWADPGHQSIPAAWSSLTFTQLVQQMHDYNSNCIVQFSTNGAMPDYVQVGNEITGGMLWPYGAVTNSIHALQQWSQLAQLINAAIQGVKDGAGTNVPPKIVIHIDRGGDWGGTEYFFDNLIFSQHVSFDVIGESYYPLYHGPLSGLQNCLTNAAVRYNKPMIVAETDFPWTWYPSTTNLFGILTTTNGQVQFTAALAQVVKGVPGNLGTGIFWWGTEYQEVAAANQAGTGDRSFFDSQGNVLPVADAFGALVAPLEVSAAMTGGSLALDWPLSGAGMLLVSTTNLSSPVWLNVTNAIQNTGTLFNATLPVGADSRFYRLQSR